MENDETMIESSTREAIKTMLLAGAKPFEIRRALKVQPWMVRRVRVQLGLNPFPAGRHQESPSPEFLENQRKAREMKQAGFSYAQIGERLGVSRQRAQQLLQGEHLGPDHCAECGAKPARLFMYSPGAGIDPLPYCAPCYGNLTGQGAWEARKAKTPADTLHAQQVKAGAKGNRKLTYEKRRAAGRKAWATRQKKLLQQHA